MKATRIVAAVACVVVVVATSSSSQVLSSATQNSSTTQAKSALIYSLALVSGNRQISDVVISGTLTRTAGDTAEASEAVLEAKGPDRAKLDFGTSGTVVRYELFTSVNQIPVCQWVEPSGTVHTEPLHNCTNAVWFFPQLSALAAVGTTSAVVQYVGPESRNGEAVDHYVIRRFLSLPIPVSANSPLAQAIQTDCYLDSATWMPVALAYSEHPDSNSLTDIAVEVRFAEYRSVGGVLVPYRVTKLMNGSVVLDLVVKAATINTGLSDDQFALQ